MAYTEPTVTENFVMLCQRASLSVLQIDASLLGAVTNAPKGFALSSLGSTRQSLEMTADISHYEFTVSEFVKGMPRALAPVVTIPFDDLGASDSKMASEPFSLTLRTDIELPAQRAVTYINADNDYQPDTQHSDRLLSDAPNTVSSASYAVALTPAQAKGVADSQATDALVSLIVARIALTGKYSYLEPGDVVVITDEDGQLYRMRITKKTDSFPLLTFELVMDDGDALVDSSATDEDYSPQTDVPVPADTIMRLLDIPLLRDADDTPGFYVATKGDGVPYAGSAVFKSPDNVSYTRVATVTESAVFGITHLDNVLGDWTGPRVFDEGNHVFVEVGLEPETVTDTLVSTTRDAILADRSANLIKIGSEILQFRNALPYGGGVYELSGLLRGCFGTEWAMTGHTDAERFELLRPAGTRRVALLNPEMGLPFYYKGVTINQTLADADEELFTCNGVSAKPYAPVDLRAFRDGSNNLTGTFRRRTRLATRFTGSLGIYVPLGEATEAYEIQPYTDDTFTTVAGTPIPLTSETWAFSAAEQIAAGLTPGDPVSMRLYQLSAAVGRGYPLEVTV